jgi:hypothetical protein
LTEHTLLPKISVIEKFSLMIQLYFSVQMERMEVKGKGGHLTHPMPKKTYCHSKDVLST